MKSSLLLILYPISGQKSIKINKYKKEFFTKMQNNIKIQSLLNQNEIETIKTYLQTAINNQKAIFAGLLVRMLFNLIDNPNSSLDTRQNLYCSLCIELKQFFSINLSF